MCRVHTAWSAPSCLPSPRSCHPRHRPPGRPCCLSRDGLCTRHLAKHSLLTGCHELPLGRELPITRSVRVGPEDRRGLGGQCRLEGTAGFPEVPSRQRVPRPPLVVCEVRTVGDCCPRPKAPSKSLSSQDSDLWEGTCHVVSTVLATSQVLGTHQCIQPTHAPVGFPGSWCLGLISLPSPHRLALPS